MKKVIVLSVLLFSVLTACNQKEQETARVWLEPDERTSVTLTLPESLPFAEVKSSLLDGYVPAFYAGEKLTVIAGGTTSRLEPLSVEGKTAVFRGVVPESSRYTVIYPAGRFSDEAAVTGRSFSEQHQSSNGSTDHVASYICLKDISSLGHLRAEKICADRLGGTAMGTTLLQVQVDVPSGVEHVDKIVLTGSDAVFYASNSATDKTRQLSLTLGDGTVDAQGRVTAWFEMASLPVKLTGSTRIEVALYAGEGEPYRHSVTPVAQTLEPMCVNRLAVGSEGWSGGSLTQDGTKEHPWLIARLSDLKTMENKLKEGNMTWFKLVADLDMSSESSWVAICHDENNKGIGFDGGGHTIRNFRCNNTGQHCALFGYLVGQVHDLKFENPVVNIDNKGGYAAVLAARLENKSACTSTLIENIEVSGASVTFAHQDYRGYAGGIIGVVSVGGNIRNCRFDGIVTNSSPYEANISYVGGIAGWAWSGNVTFSGCRVSGAVTYSGAKNGFAGGIVGQLYKTGTVVENCSVEASVSGHDCTGGIAGSSAAVSSAGGIVIRNCSATGDVSTSTGGWTGGIIGSLGTGGTVENCYASGHVSGKYMALGGIVGAASNKTSTAVSTSYSNSVINCIAWNASVKTSYPYDYKPDTNNAHLSSGAVVGFGGDKNTYADCLRRPDMDYAICTRPASWLESLPLFDQDNASASSVLSQSGKTADGRTVDGSALTNTFHPYHGKAAGSSRTPSDLARTLSWNTSIWDLNTDIPQLISSF